MTGARWYRYHSLFAQILQAQLQWHHPDVVADLYARAARWYADHGEETRAVQHAIKGEAWDLVARIAADRWLDLLLRGL